MQGSASSPVRVGAGKRRSPASVRSMEHGTLGAKHQHSSAVPIAQNRRSELELREAYRNLINRAKSA